MKISSELKAGIITVVTLALLYWGFNFLKGKDLFNKKFHIYAVYEKVDGLTTSREVSINGFKVGSVEKIEFHPDGSGHLVVTMNIESKFAVPHGSVARISGDLLGDKSIELLLSDSTSTVTNGDTLLSQVELSLQENVNRQLAPLKQKTEKLIGSVDTVLVLISGFLNDETKKNFVETFNSIQRSFQVLENTVTTVDRTVTEAQTDLQTTLSNIASITTTLKENNDELDKIFSNLSNVSDSLAQIKFKQTFATLNEALESTRQVMEKINNGDGSIGLLLNDPEVYENMNKATEQLNLLLLDIKYNPRRYLHFSVFGGNKEYSEEEILEMEEENKKKREENSKSEN